MKKLYLLRHAEAAAIPIKTWMGDPKTAGLAKLVLNRLDQLPEPLAVACVELALQGDMAEDARAAPDRKGARGGGAAHLRRQRGLLLRRRP